MARKSKSTPEERAARESKAADLKAQAEAAKGRELATAEQLKATIGVVEAVKAQPANVTTDSLIAEVENIQRVALSEGMPGVALAGVATKAKLSGLADGRPVVEGDAGAPAMTTAEFLKQFEQFYGREAAAEVEAAIDALNETIDAIHERHELRFGKVSTVEMPNGRERRVAQEPIVENGATVGYRWPVWVSENYVESDD